MKTFIIIILLLSALQVSGADRVVLLEDFVNCGCGYCWAAEPALNAFVNNHVGSGLAVIRVHVSWPNPNDPIYAANRPEQNARVGFYGVGGVPYFKIDGVLTPSSGNLEGAYSSRSSVPTNLQIFVARNGNDETGSISIRLIAEAEIVTGEILRLFSTVVENDVPGAGYWVSIGFDQAFRDNIFGIVGPVVEFTAPYPDTLYFEADYDVTSWVNDNLYLVTFVQEYATASKEVINAHWAKFMDLETGIAASSGDPAGPELVIYSNPAIGNIQISVEFRESTDCGVISVYDMTGRLIVSRTADEYNNFEIDEPGLYIVRLETSGIAVTESVVVIR